MHFNDRHLQERVRSFSALLRRVTPNHTVTAAILGISRPLMSMYCNAEDPDHNLPAALIPLHPESHEILDMLARDTGYELTPLPEHDTLDGSVSDEREQILILLGRIADAERSAQKNAAAKLTRQRALKLRDAARQLRRLAAQLEAEIDHVLDDGR